jgi:hypothetical protein
MRLVRFLIQVARSAVFLDVQYGALNRLWAVGVPKDEFKNGQSYMPVGRPIREQVCKRCIARALVVDRAAANHSTRDGRQQEGYLRREIIARLLVIRKLTTTTLQFYIGNDVLYLCK